MGSAENPDRETAGMDALRSLLAAHRRLKHKIHNTRIPLSPAGQRVAKVVYFCIPLVVGKFAYDWVVEVQQSKWGVDPVTGKMRVPDAVAKRERETLENAANARASVEHVLKHRHEDLPR